MEFLEHKLPNGLTIVAERNPQARTAALGFFVNAGARDENDSISGVSHFLEHMAFKGTPTRSADDVNRHFDEMGADYNAYTNEENTVYYATVLPEHLLAAADLLVDIMRPSLRDEDFNVEKQVIIEEIRMYDDQPPYGADDLCRARHYGGHPLSRSVLGTAASVGALQVEQMRDYFQQRYSPGNMTLVACGQIDFEALVARLEKTAGDWTPQAVSRTLEPHSGSGGFFAVAKESSIQQYVLRVSNGPAAADPDRYAAKLAAAILGDDTGSRLYWELVDPGLVEHASLGHYGYQGAGLFILYLSCDPRLAGDNLQCVVDLLRSAERDGLTSVELEQAKSKMASRVVLAGERSRGRLFSVGSNWLNRGEYRTVADDLASIESVKLDDVLGVMRRFPLFPATTIAIGPSAEVPEPVE